MYLPEIDWNGGYLFVANALGQGEKDDDDNDDDDHVCLLVQMKEDLLREDICVGEDMASLNVFTDNPWRTLMVRP